MIYRRGKGVACLDFEVARMAADIYNRGGALKAGIQNLSFFRFSERAENAVKTAAIIVKTFRARKRK